MRAPWRERNGNFSALGAATFALLCAPALAIVFDAATGGLGAKPVTEALHRSGEWGMWILVATLFVTPLRRMTEWNKLIGLRRMIGVAAFAYFAAHFALYVLDMRGDVGRVASEIVLRVYLTIGFAALAGFAILAATSTDAAIRRLGPNWRRLHLAVHPLAALGIIHYFMQSKTDVGPAAVMAGLWLLALGWRLAARVGLRLNRAAPLVRVAIAAALATALIEAGWYAAASGAPWRLVLEANFVAAAQPRPAIVVLLGGLAFALVPQATRLARAVFGADARKAPSRARPA